MIRLNGQLTKAALYDDTTEWTTEQKRHCANVSLNGQPNGMQPSF